MPNRDHYTTDAYVIGKYLDSIEPGQGRVYSDGRQRDVDRAISLCKPGSESEKP
jgi:hypothetical protein